MSDTPFLAELRLMSFNFAPQGWAQASGQFLPINQNQALFSLLGTTYGGNGQTNFALPDLRGRVPIHRGNGFALGQRAGEEAHTVTQQELPTHTHQVSASPQNGTQAVPGLLSAVNNQWGALSDLTPLHPQTLTAVGGSQAHENRPPSLVLNWCIALVGIFPSQN